MCFQRSIKKSDSQLDHHNTGDTVMPGQGHAIGREALRDAVAVPGDVTVDVYLNNNARRSNVPIAVWKYKLGGYQVLETWLLCHECEARCRRGVQHFTGTERRIAAILLSAGVDEL